MISYSDPSSNIYVTTGKSSVCFFLIINLLMQELLKTMSILSNSIFAKVLISQIKAASIKFRNVVLLEPLEPMKILICS